MTPETMITLCLVGAVALQTAGLCLLMWRQHQLKKAARLLAELLQSVNDRVLLLEKKP